MAISAKLEREVAPSNLLKFSYELLLGSAVIGLVALAGIAAGREYTLAGTVLVFTLLLHLFGLILASNRYTLCTALMLMIFLLTVDQVDQIKYEHLQSRLNPYDLLMITSMIAHADFTVANQYSHLMWPFLSASCIAACILVLAYKLEKQVASIPHRILKTKHIVFIACLALFTIQLIVVCKSRYLETTSKFQSYLTSVEPGGLRIGSAANFGWRMVMTWSQLHKSPELAQRVYGGSREHSATGARTDDCSSCPDLIFVHLESTFDPALLDEYSSHPGYLDHMAAEGERRSRSGPLLVNVYGGSSWISEFELLCGVHHTVFGEAGLYPHAFVSPYLKGCVPSYLKFLGYKTEAIYTTNPFFAGVAAGFRNYGIDRFLDSQSIGAPIDWRDQRDIHFIDALRKRLASQAANLALYLCRRTAITAPTVAASPEAPAPASLTPPSLVAVKSQTT